MKEFGIYTFALKKAAPKSAITAYIQGDLLRNDFMLGEVDLGSKVYEGLPLEVACKKRIEQELKAKHGLSFFDMNDITDLKCYRVWANKTSHVDTDIRNYCIKSLKDVSIVDGTTEVLHNISRHWLDKGIEGYAKNDPDIYRVDSFDLYSYQKALKVRALAWLNYHNRCLYHLSTRGGKSYLALETAREDGAENILILTPFPAAQQSFADIIKFHTKFKGWKFYTKEDITDDTIFQPTHNAILLSWQIFDTELEKLKIKNILSQIKFTHSIIDETHNTSSSMRSITILNNIEDDIIETDEENIDLKSITDNAVKAMENAIKDLKQIHLSGTPYNDILGDRFSKDETFTFDFIDLIKLDKQTHEVGFPELSIWNVSNMKILNRLLVKAKPNVFDLEEGFTLKKAFATRARTRAIIDVIFDNIFNPEDADILDGTEDNRLVIDGIKNKHILAFVPTIKAATWAEEYIKEKFSTSSNPTLRKYKALAVSGITTTGNNIDTSAKKGGLERAVNDFEAKNDYTIIITCLKLTTGVTLKRTDSILLLRNCSSVETFIQILFRAMTPNKDKLEANLYCFDSEIMLKTVKETMQIRREKEGNTTDTECIKELLGVINFKKFWVDSGFEFDTASADAWLSAVKDIPVNLNLFKIFNSATLSNMISNLTTEQRDALLSLNLIRNSNNKGKRTIAKGVGGNLKQRNYKPSEDQHPYSQAEITRLLKGLEMLFLHLDWTIINNGIKNVDELFNNYHIELDNDIPNFVRND